MESAAGAFVRLPATKITMFRRELTCEHDALTNHWPSRHILPKRASIPGPVSAPTMRVPSDINRTLNVYLAFRAALIAVLNHNARNATPIQSLLVPGMDTGVGDVLPERAARQMRLAYDNIILGQALKSRNAGTIWGEHQELMS